MEKRKVLILGANPETISLILKAKEMGLYTIVTDYDPSAYAKKFADQAEDIDALDVDALVALARREGVAGVLVGVAEALLPTYCEVCRQLGVPAYSSQDKFEFMTRKDLFKAKCREYGVPAVREFTGPDDPSLSFPVIVKPVDSCSSKGIRVCHDAEELRRGIECSLSFSGSGKYLIEEYMTGDEVIAYYVMQAGNPIFVGMCDRYTYKPGAELVQLPNSYVFPSRYIDQWVLNSDAVVKDMIRGLGLANGSIFFQCFVDDEGIIRIYEPGYRLNGAQEHLLISRLSGIDARELYINYALTGKVADEDLAALSNPRPNKLSCKLSPLVRLGHIAKLAGLEEIAQLPDVVSVNPSYEQGDTVEGAGTLKQIVCRFFIISETKNALMETIERIYALLEVEDDAGMNMLVGRFDTGLIDALY